MITSVISLTITLFFAAFNAFCAFAFGEASKEWYLAIAGYFLVFALLRFTIVVYKWTFWKRSKEKPYNLHIVNGVIFLVLVVAFGFSVCRMIISGGVVKNSVLLTITAIHTVFKVWNAVKRARKAYSKDDVVKITIRNIVLAESLISFVTLLASIKVTFGDGNLASPLMYGVSAIVCLFIFYLGVKMIVEGSQGKRLIKK